MIKSVESVYKYGFLSNVPLAVFQGILLFIVSNIILNLKYSLRDYLLIAGIIIPSSILYYFLIALH